MVPSLWRRSKGFQIDMIGESQDQGRSGQGFGGGGQRFRCPGCESNVYDGISVVVVVVVV